MNVYITRINGGIPLDTTQLGQSMTARIACQLGYKEMGIYHYEMDSDPEKELHIRADGIIGGMSAGDVGLSDGYLFFG